MAGRRKFSKPKPMSKAAESAAIARRKQAFEAFFNTFGKDALKSYLQGIFEENFEDLSSLKEHKEMSRILLCLVFKKCKSEGVSWRTNIEETPKALFQNYLKVIE